MQSMGLTGIMRSVPASSSPTIALIDATVDTTHATLAGTSIKLCGPLRSGIGCEHATAMASVVVGHEPAIGACRDGKLLAFDLADQWVLFGLIPPPEVGSRIASHIIAACEQGAQVILLGFELLQDSRSFVSALIPALEQVRIRELAVFAPAGNTSRSCNHPFLAHPNVFPVVPATDKGGADARTTWGPVIASGLLAPGSDIPVAARDNSIGFYGGSSFAAALAASACGALLARAPRKSAAAICRAMRTSPQSRSLTVPPSVNVCSAYQIITSHRSV